MGRQYIYKGKWLSKTKDYLTTSTTITNYNKGLINKKGYLLNPLKKCLIKPKKGLINYLINQPFNDPLEGKKWLSKTMDLLNHYAFFLGQLENKRKATVVLLLLANKVTYFGQLKRLFGEKVNPASIVFVMDDLTRRGIIRETEKKEFLDEKRIFEGICRNPIKRFYCLTDDAFEFYSLFEEKIKGLSIRFDLLTKEKEWLSNIKKQITPKELPKKIVDYCRICHRKGEGHNVWFIGKKGVKERLFACGGCIDRKGLGVAVATDKGSYEFAQGGRK